MRSRACLLWLLVATLNPAYYCWQQNFLGYVHLKGQELTSTTGEHIGYCSCRDTQEAKLEIQLFKGSACETLLPGVETLSIDKNGATLTKNGTIMERWDCDSRSDLFNECNCKSMVDYYGKTYPGHGDVPLNFGAGCNTLNNGSSVKLSCGQWGDDNNIACLNTDVNAAMYVCDNLPNCNGFNRRQTDDLHTSLKHFVDNPAVDTYIAHRHCGNKGSGFVRGNYLMCSNTGLNFEMAKDTYKLPPFLVAEACDVDPLCSAFTVSNDGQTGKLYRYQEFVDDYNYTAFIKVRQVGLTPPPFTAPPPPKNVSFMEFPGARIDEVVAAPHPGCWHCGEIKPGTPGCSQLLDSAMLMTMCSGNAECDAFRAPAIGAGGSLTTEATVFSMWAKDETMTSIIRTDVCVPLTTAQGDGFLECNRLDATQPVLISSYNLPKSLLIEACEWAKCHAIVIRNDNKFGAIFHFNQSATNSYIKLTARDVDAILSNSAIIQTPGWLVSAVVIGILAMVISALMVTVWLVIRHRGTEVVEESATVYTRMT